MNKKIIIWIVIGILFLAALYLIFKVGSGSAAIQNIGSSTNPGVSSSSSSGMVGGC